MLPTRSSRAERAPAQDEARVFFDLAEQALERFRPDVMLTHGGHPVDLQVMAAVRRRGTAVVFHLHNFSNTDRRGLADASAMLVPTECARRLYAERQGLCCVHRPLPLNPDRVVATECSAERRYVTFVNPQLIKGVAVVARIALVLAERRPDIPILIVESRSGADDMGRLGLDLSGPTNVHRMANTPDPRDFYKLGRVKSVSARISEGMGENPSGTSAPIFPVQTTEKAG